MALVADLLDLQADFRVLAHPLDFLTDCREGVETVPFRVEREVDGHDVGLVVARTAKASQMILAEHLGASLGFNSWINADSAQAGRAGSCTVTVVPPAGGHAT